MKQVIQRVGTGEISVVEVPAPQAVPGMLLVRTAASLISAGTERSLLEFSSQSMLGKARARPDLVRRTLQKAGREGVLAAVQAVQTGLDEPMPIGYSSAGTVAQVGAGVEGFRPGDRVACAGGGFAVHAEYALVPVNLAARLPENVTFEHGAFATLGAIALHGLRLSEARLGESVAVIGLGLIGQLALSVARAAGCRAFGVDLSPTRVELARQMGGEAGLRDQAETAGRRISGLAGFDAVLICASGQTSDPLELAAAIARDRATIVAIGAVGLQVPRAEFYAKELRLFVSRSYGPGRYDPAYEGGGQDYPIGFVRWTEGRNLQAFVDLVAEGRVHVEALISHRIPVEDAPRAYAILTEPQVESLGLVLTYPAGGAAEPSRRIDFRARGAPTSPAASVGALGAGNFATRVLFPILRTLKGVELVGVAAERGLRAAEAGRRFGFQYAAGDADQILSDPSVNTVAVLTRHHRHAGQTVAALQAGKHVLCEKPLALTKEELAEVEAEVRHSDRLLCVGFNRRFAPMGIRLRRFVQGNGPWVGLARVNAGRLPSGHWLLDPAQGGGRIVGEACHYIDLFAFLFDAVPRSVRAERLPGGAGPDDALLTIEYGDGSLGTIAYYSGGHPLASKERIEVHGGGRAAVLDDFRRLDLWQGGRHQSHRSLLRQDKGHRGLWEAFVSAVVHAGSPPIPYEHIFAVSLAAIAARDALASGEAMSVSLPSLP